MKKPRIPKTQKSNLYDRLFNNEFHPYASIFHVSVCFRFYRRSGQLRVRKLGCSAVSQNGISFRINEKDIESFIPPGLVAIDSERVSVTIGHESVERNTTNTWFTYNYCLPDNISTATFEYAGNTYEVF